MMMRKPPSPHPWLKTLRTTAFVLSLALLTAACSDSDDDNSSPDNGQNGQNGQNVPTSTEVAVVATAADDFTSGAFAVVTTEAPFTAEQNLLPTFSDITVASYGEHFYTIERKDRDSIAKVKASAPEEVIWQYSVLDDGEGGSANPHAMIFVDETKAYVLRYGKPVAWIVNPSATSAAEFKIGEIDLSAYSTDRESPSMTSGIIVDGKLYILMQRLDASFTPLTAYVAVIDTATDTEINTGTSAEFNGIELPVENPSVIQTDGEGMLYVQGFGHFTPVYSGGVATIDTDTYATELLVDDGDDSNHPYGQFSGMQIVSAERGYLIGYNGYKDNHLLAFNPMTGVIEDGFVADLQGRNVTTLSMDSQQRVWVGVGAFEAESAKLMVLNPADNSQVGESVLLDFNPLRVTFPRVNEEP